jgi:subtilisin family serine protease
MVAAFAVALHPPAASAAGGHYIVVMQDGAAVVTPTGVAPDHRYGSALTGYSATMTAAAAASVAANPNVKAVLKDSRVHLTDTTPTQEPSTEVAPFGVIRVGALASTTAKIDAIDERVNASIAVLDTGVDAAHPDLNVVGSVSCLTGDTDGARVDPSGHGTGVAGVAAAIDNRFGVVGVAPGARIWSVKVLDADGNGTLSDVLCGINWVAAHAATIDVVNFSISDDGTDNPGCGYNDNDPLHEAICKVVDKGVTFVASAANDAADARNFVPAAYDQVIAVSAFADYDGQSGGIAATNPDCAGQGADDHFATFSNFGHDIDLAAPGVCIRTTYPGALYATWSGTSFAAPHVAGGAALYISRHHKATPRQIKAVLLRAGEHHPIPGDPDHIHEPILNVSTF